MSINLTVFGIQSEESFGTPIVSKISQKPILSPLVKTQVPDFVKEDHINFISFLEAYYEWLEFSGQADHEIQRLIDYQDIDTTIDRFAEVMKKEFLANIPRNTAADKENVLKNIREFYRAKGTEKSFRFFFRVLFNKEIDFYYPRVDILRVSDGKWIQNKILRVISVNGNPFDFQGRRIRGRNGNSSAFVDNVLKVQEGLATFYELYLNRSSITGEFSIDEEIITTDNIVSANVAPTIISASIQNGGQGYVVGQEIEVVGGGGAGARLEVKSVDSNGSITSLRVANYGIGYTSQPTLIFPSDPPVTQIASGSVQIGSLITTEGYYLNQDGQLSTTKYLQDSYFYQQFSYVIFADESIEKYRDALKRLLHPAGWIFFGGFRTEIFLDASLSLPENGLANFLVTLILQQFHNPQNSEQMLPYNAEVQSEQYQVFLRHQKLLPSLGPVRDDLRIWKYGYKPVLNYDANIEMGGANSQYWGTSKTQQRIDGDGITDIFNLNYQTDEPGYLYVVYSGFNNPTLVPGVDYDVINSGTQIQFFSTPGPNTHIYVIYKDAEIANYQISHFGTLLPQDFIDRPNESINILPSIRVANNDNTGIGSEESFGTPDISIV
jgi:hypothetical protein